MEVYGIVKKKGVGMKVLLIIVLSVLLTGMTYVAWHNSQPLNCNKIMEYEDGSASCVVKIRDAEGRVYAQDTSEACKYQR